MKITSKKAFHFVHNGKEEFELDPKVAVEISQEAYAHLVYTFGDNWFTVVAGKAPAVPSSPVNQAVAEKAASGTAPKDEDENEDDGEDAEKNKK